MYPDTELDGLALRKALLCARIGVRRQICVMAAARVVEPLRWIDRALVQWRKISPLVKLGAVPVGLLLKRKLFPRGGMIGKLLRWGPLVLGAFRVFSAMQRGKVKTPARAGEGSYASSPSR